MTPVTEDLLQEMTDAIVAAVAPERVVLFGSHARDMAGPHSDLDLLIIEEDDFGQGRSRRKEMARLWRLLARFRVPKDILVYSRGEAESFAESKNHVVARALREGRLLYERPATMELVGDVIARVRPIVGA